MCLTRQVTARDEKTPPVTPFSGHSSATTSSVPVCESVSDTTGVRPGQGDAARDPPRSGTPFPDDPPHGTLFRDDCLDDHGLGGGYEPFALHAPIHWAISGYVIGDQIAPLTPQGVWEEEEDPHVWDSDLTPRAGVTLHPRPKTLRA